MSKLRANREVLNEEIPKIEELFLWAMENMKKCEPKTPQQERWFYLMIHLGQQVNLLRMEAIDAISETWD